MRDSVANLTDPITIQLYCQPGHPQPWRD